MFLINGFLEIIGDVSMFDRGDVNGSDNVDLSDSVYTLEFLFLGGPPPPCLDAADATDDGKIDVSDAVRTLEMLFLGADPLVAPYPDHGPDPTGDDFTCGFDGT